MHLGFRAAQFCATHLADKPSTISYSFPRLALSQAIINSYKESVSFRAQWDEAVARTAQELPPLAIPGKVCTYQDIGLEVHFPVLIPTVKEFIRDYKTSPQSCDVPVAQGVCIESGVECDVVLMRDPSQHRKAVLINRTFTRIVRPRLSSADNIISTQAQDWFRKLYEKAAHESKVAASDIGTIPTVADVARQS